VSLLLLPGVLQGRLITGKQTCNEIRDLKFCVGSLGLIYTNALLFMHSYSVFGSVVAGVFQIIFRVKIHANDFFYFLKIIFDISTSKRSKTYKSY
jgi:hypothetical protein